MHQRIGYYMRSTKISHALNADSGRYDDAIISYTARWHGSDIFTP